MSAQTVHLWWDESPAPDVETYTVYAGRSSGIYEVIVDMGNVLEGDVVVDGDGTWFFSRTVTTTSLGESAHSAEVTLLIKAPAMLLR